MISRNSGAGIGFRSGLLDCEHITTAYESEAELSVVLGPAGQNVQRDGEEAFAHPLAHQIGGAYGLEGAHADVTVVTLEVAALK